MATMNVSLPDAMKAWVEAQAKGDRYTNASDYVRDLIRKDQDRAAKIAELQALIDEGLASGPPRPFDPDQLIAEMRAKRDQSPSD